MGQAGIGDQNKNRSDRRMRSDKNNGSGRSRRSVHEWVRQEEEIRTWMGQAGVGDQTMSGSGRRRRSEHGWVRQE
jgi:hypothetical protein